MPPYTKKGLIDGIFDSIDELSTSFDELSTSFDELNTTINNTIESVTGGIKSINTDHANIHEGQGFGFYQIADTLAYGEFKRFRFKAPTTKYAHIKGIQIVSESATCRLRIKHSVTIVNPGYLINNVFVNKNHNSSNVPQSKCYGHSVENPLSYTGGVIWAAVTIPGNADKKTNNSGNFSQVDFDELVTKSSGEEYIIEVENIDQDESTAENVSINFFFYEEESGSSE